MVGAKIATLVENHELAPKLPQDSFAFTITLHHAYSQA